jgi:DNA-binding beta-propeller fold protein YncE
VTSFSINRTTGDLTLLNVVSSQGAGPAHLSVDPLGQFVFVANYGGGSIAVLPILMNGSLANASDVHQDIDSVGPTHATNAPPGSFAISGHDAPHAHMIQADPAGKFVLHTDLGQDRIYSWLLNRLTGKLTPNPTSAFTAVPPGDGPRHFAFHPNAKWFYSLQEESSTLLFYTYDAASGVLTRQQMLSTLPPGFAGTDFTSEVRVSQDGKFVYAANRLHDTIAVFSVGAFGKADPSRRSLDLGRLSAQLYHRSNREISVLVQPEERRHHHVPRPGRRRGRADAPFYGPVHRRRQPSDHGISGLTSIPASVFRCRWLDGDAYALPHQASTSLQRRERDVGAGHPLSNRALLGS